MTAADEDRQEPRTAGSLTVDDLGRQVTVRLPVTGVLAHLADLHGPTFIRTSDGRVIDLPADTPVHVHDEGAGR